MKKIICFDISKETIYEIDKETALSYIEGWQSDAREENNI